MYSVHDPEGYDPVGNLEVLTAAPLAECIQVDSEFARLTALSKWSRFEPRMGQLHS